MSVFRDFLRRILPPWLAGGEGNPGQVGYWGGRFMYSIGLFTDSVMEGVQFATRSRFLEPQVPTDALPHAGDTSNMERYPADTNATYLARLTARWDTWPHAGTEWGPQGNQGVGGQLVDFGFDPSAIWIYENHDIDNPWPHDVDNWSRFWIVLEPPHDFTWAKWGVPVYGGFTWGYSIISTGQPIDLKSSLRNLVRKWKPAHVICVEIILLDDAAAALWGHNMTWGSFIWGSGNVARIPG